nr:unnamed protein product [Callosobruchus analis]
MTLIKLLKDTSSKNLKNYLRMDEACFNKLLILVKPYIARTSTAIIRKTITAEERLIVTR